MNTLLLKINRVEPASDNAILVFLEELNGRPVPYEAGQFLTFIIDRYGREVRRSYSLATAPGIDSEMAVVIKKIVNGEISRYLVENIKRGDIVKTLFPAGRFTIRTDPDNRRTIFFIAAGSGISPVFGLLKSVLFAEPWSQAILIYQNHDENSIIFKDALRALTEIFHDRFKCIILLSEPKEKGHQPVRLNNTLLEQIILKHAKIHSVNEFYLCGPGGFMRLAQFVIKLLGFGDDKIHKENFVIDIAPPPPFIGGMASKSVKLIRKGREFNFKVTYPENVLQAALNNGIDIPYSCRGGRCATCTVKCLSGSAKMSINEVLTEREVQNGLILACVAYAETDLVLEF